MHSFPSKRIILVVLGILWFEFSFSSVFSFKDTKPDFFVLFLSFYIFRISWREALPLGFLIGLAQELITNSFFGLQIVSYMSAALFLQLFASGFDREKKWIYLIGLFVSSWLAAAVFSILSFALGTRYFSTVDWILIKTLAIASYTTALGFLFYEFLEKYLMPLFGLKQYELFRK